MVPPASPASSATPSRSPTADRPRHRSRPSIDGRGTGSGPVSVQSAVVATISLTTVEFRPTVLGTALRLTEQAVYLDEHERPEWREHGTAEWLDALARELD
ncbi:hypothetical protein [Dactylosporangium matsuzakiense]|uniref:Uncharacterized protein n=1 Tax=Dactylosporangium matsuzakiense TaxID=53360 RepID=A0A9W6KEI3_9ACTN|nr:hypothetical protein [Dactylosporangium matsuzakiense]UWZ42182.1 hypothetical protein Dmats_31960 [Dactylosporangium matsuzakiense]GLK99822.1 hypothetical protein GCM10017581_015630 [Dactylosporangium matsuzakiense]